jgi:hypothetical protein
MRFWVVAALGLILIDLSGRAIAAQEAQVGDKWAPIATTTTVDEYHAPKHKRHSRVRHISLRSLATARGEARIVPTAEAPPMVDSIVSLLREQSCVDVQTMAWNKVIDVAIDRWMTERHMWKRSDASGRPNPAK